jgi:hypothetical protein
MTRRPPPHGTDARYRRHLRAGEIACNDCTRAHTDYNHHWWRARHAGLSRDELQAIIWQHWPTRGEGAERSVAAVLQAADAYAQGSRFVRPQPPPERPVLRHSSSTDLYPLIGALADALLGGGQEAAA